MKSVLLINPPITVSAEGRRALIPPLGLAYLAATLRMGNFEVSILDCVMEGDLRETPVRPGFVRLGLTPEEIEVRVANAAPTLAAIACSASDQAENAHLVADAVKRLRARKNIDILTAIGGPHVTALPYEVMSDANVDFAVMGEGETPMYRLCDCLRARRQPDQVEGVCYRDDYGTAIVNRPQQTFPDVDQIPMPARDLLNLPRYLHAPSYYFNAVTPHTTMVLARGCPSQCVYCEVPRIFGSTFRKRSVPRIMEEIAFLREEYGVREVEFVGDNLFHDHAWSHSWMRALVKDGRGLRWSTASGQSLYNLDVQTAALAVESGLHSMVLDITSLVARTYLRAYKRPGDLDSIQEVISLLKQNRVNVGGLFTIGAPGETRDSMVETVKTAFSLGLHDIRVRTMTPFPGSPLWDECAEKKYFYPVPQPAELMQDWGYIRTPQFTPANVVWTRDWAEVHGRIRQGLAHPSKHLAAIGPVLFNTLFHPVTQLMEVWKLIKVMTGTPLSYTPPSGTDEA